MGSGCAGGTEGAKEEGAGHDGEHDRGGEDGIFPGSIGNEGDAGLVGELVVFALIGGLADETAGHGPLADAVLSVIKMWSEGKAEEHAGNDEDMQGEKARERGSADDRAAEQQMDERRADERDATSDGRANAQTPVSVLIEPQNLAGEGHAERQQKRNTPTIQVSSRGNL